ncbi:TPA: YibE/F [Candidatus Uhrbacteria bacterium]|nr:YibE/F [Candidatus Uhrbacteria bacterium]
MFIKKNFFIFLLFTVGFLFSTSPLLAAEEKYSNSQLQFKALVTEVIESNEVGQKLRLVGLGGDWEGKDFVYDGTVVEVISRSEYKTGDRVWVNHQQNSDGQDVFYVTDFVRTGVLNWLWLLFVAVVILVGRFKGFRALVTLALSFLIILRFIIPLILAGGNPLLVSIVGCIFILILAIYVTEGFNRRAHLALFSTVIALIITGILSLIFTALAKLSGFVSEDTMFLTGLGDGNINLRGLFLAGIIIGTLGVLDDVVISQIVLVEELKKAGASGRDLYKKAMRVGISHLSSMINTLFLAYAGVSLPLLILFSANEGLHTNLSQALSSEMIASEIIRTLVGSIGLVLSVPISTGLAVSWFESFKDKKSTRRFSNKKNPDKIDQISN